MREYCWKGLFRDLPTESICRLPFEHTSLHLSKEFSLQHLLPFTQECPNADLARNVFLTPESKACFEISPQKAFADFPFNTRVYLSEQIEICVASVFKAEFYGYFVICGNTAGKACFEISPQKAFADFPLNTRVYLFRVLLLFRYMCPLQHTSLSAEFYCYIAICRITAGMGCFEISPQKAFPEVPFHTRVYLCKLNAHIDNRSYILQFTQECPNAAIARNVFLTPESKACFEISPQKAFADVPFNTRVYLSEQIEICVVSVFKAEFYCYFVICGNTAGKACFEISPQKAFADFPLNTRIYL
ncbi:hypothetical protein P7K49_040298, partial [Saguinus oedipus]